MQYLELGQDSKKEIKDAVARRLDLARSQIETNEKEVLKTIKENLVTIAFDFAESEIKKKLDPKMMSLVNERSLDEIKVNLP